MTEVSKDHYLEDLKKSKRRKKEVFKDLAVDPTAGQLADHQKTRTTFSGLGTKGLARPESASTVATESSPPPKAAPTNTEFRKANLK